MVLLHGQLMPRRMHQPLARALAAEGLHVVTLDLLGHGRSDRPADPLVYSMTAFAEQVVALLDHLGATQAVVGGTSLGANVALEVADMAPERVRGLIVEMPVLDNAVEAGILAFAPLMFAARFLPFTVDGLRAVTRPIPRGVVPFWAGIVLDTLDQRADSVAAVVHGLFFGRVAPSSKRRRAITAPALVVGPPRRPDPPGRRRRDAGRGDAQRDVRPRPEHPGVAVLARRLNHEAAEFALEVWAQPTRAPTVAEPGTGRAPLYRDEAIVLRGVADCPRTRQTGGVPLYRDEAIVLRTHKLGEADRIITLLTREHGRVRAVAKGVRRTTSKFGSRLEPFTHVDLQLAEGRNLDTSPRPRPGRRSPRALGADYERYTAGTVMLETAERLVTEEKEPAAPAVPAARRRRCGRWSAASAGPARCSTPTCCARCRWPATRRRSSTAPAAGVEGPHRWFNPSMGGMLCATCRVPGSAGPAPETVALLGALLAGDWPVVEAADPRHLKEASGLVAAFLAWHLERGLRSLAYVER